MAIAEDGLQDLPMSVRLHEAVIALKKMGSKKGLDFW